MDHKDLSGDDLGPDVASARAIVSLRREVAPKSAMIGQYNSRSKHTDGMLDSALQHAHLVDKAAGIDATEEAAGRLACSVYPSHNQLPTAAGAAAVPSSPRRTRSRSISPKEIGTVDSDVCHKGPLTRTLSRGASKQQQPAVHKLPFKQALQQEQVQDEFGHAADQATVQPDMLGSEAAASTETAANGSQLAGQQAAAASKQEQLLPAQGTPTKKRGRPTKTDQQMSLGGASLPGASGQVEAEWPGAWQVQRDFQLTVTAEPPLKQRRKPGRPPKSAVAAGNSMMPPPDMQRQPGSSNRLSSASEGHRVSLDKPYRTIGWLSAGVHEVGGQPQQQQLRPAAETGALADAADLTTAAPGTAMRTRLSMRSVAYLEDLLEQTAQAAAGGNASENSTKDTQAAARSEYRVAPLPSKLGSCRLSVGNLIISPPMSRAPSMYPTAAGASPTAAAPAAREPSPAALTSPAERDTAQAAVSKQGQLVDERPGLEHTEGPVSGSLQASVAGGAGAAASAPAANLSRAAATAAIAAFKQAAAATTTDTGSSDSDSSSGEDSDDEPGADVWIAAANAAGVAAARTATKQANNRQPSYSSDTSSPSSGSPVYDRRIVGPFTAAGSGPGAGVARGLVYGSLFQGFAGGPSVVLPGHQAPSAAGPFGAFQLPRKSDRQLGLETVQRIDAIFRQQSRSLQAVQAANGTAADTSAAAAATVDTPRAAQQDAAPAEDASTPKPPAAVAAPEVQEVVNDERCTVAALCRGLRFDGDITLKEVAMAFQLRDAYDWDEDLEAAGKEGKAVEDPRLKGPKLLSRSPSQSNSSVCPDPEPVPGFFPRSTWMAGNGREGASPMRTSLSQSGMRGQSGQEFHPGAVAAGLAPALLQRLHRQSATDGMGSQPGSVSSSRRASLAASPINPLGQEQLGQPPAPAALQAALSNAQQQGPRGWAALMPGMPDADPSMQGMQAYPYMPMKAPGRGHGRGRKRKNADDSDDDYDPRKPSHQQEVYQRKQIDRRGQHHYQQQRMYNPRIGRYGYSYQAMQQAYSAAAMQQAYMMQTASKTGSGFSMQQIQQLQQLQYMQQHAQMAMAAMDQQADAAAAANGGETAGPAGGSQHHMQSPAHSTVRVKQEQPTPQPEKQQQGVQQLQSASQVQGQPSQPMHQQQGQHPQPASQLQPGPRPLQPVRRPSYVKRRLTADDAADWLQIHAPDSQFRLQAQRPSLTLAEPNGQLGLDDPDGGLQILSPTAVRPPGAGRPGQQGSRPSIKHSGRLRQRTLAGIEYDVVHGHISGAESAEYESDDDIDSDVSDAEVGYSAGSRGGRRGGRGSRGRGRGTRGRGRGSGRSSLGLNRPVVGGSMASPASSAQPAASTGTENSPANSGGSPAVHSGGRGRGRRGLGRGRGAARGRSNLSSVALASQPEPAAAAGAAGGLQQQQGVVGQPAVQQPGSNTAAVAAGTASPGRGRGRGRARGRGRTSSGLQGPAGASAAWAGGSASLTASPAGSPAAGGRRGRGTSRGRGRVGRPPLSSYVAGARAIAAAFPQHPTADYAADGSTAACGGAANGVQEPGRHKIDTSTAEVAQQQQQLGTVSLEGPAKPGLSSMPSWFAAGLLPDPQAAVSCAEGSDPGPGASLLPPLSAQEAQHMPELDQQGLVSPPNGLRPARASLRLICQAQAQPPADAAPAAGQGEGQVQHQPQAEQPGRSVSGWLAQAPGGSFEVQIQAQEAADPTGDIMMTDLACHESLL